MKNSFIAQLIVKLWFAAMGLGPVAAFFLAPLAAWALGDLMDREIVKADIAIDKLKEAMKDPEWRDVARKLYEKSTARVYSEEEKSDIRKQYLSALSKYATFGGGMSDNKHS
jgi:hypothetical protein